MRMAFLPPAPFLPRTNVHLPWAAYPLAAFPLRFSGLVHPDNVCKRLTAYGFEGTGSMSAKKSLKAVGGDAELTNTTQRIQHRVSRNPNFVGKNAETMGKVTQDLNPAEDHSPRPPNRGHTVGETISWNPVRISLHLVGRVFRSFHSCHSEGENTDCRLNPFRRLSLRIPHGPEQIETLVSCDRAALKTSAGGTTSNEHPPDL